MIMMRVLYELTQTDKHVFISCYVLLIRALRYKYKICLCVVSAACKELVVDIA